MAINDDLIGHIHALQQMVDELAQAAEAHERAPDGQRPKDVRRLIRSIVRIRTERRDVFQPALFGEPAWDMLLELYDAHLANRRDSVSALCANSGVPDTTALRWLKLLESDGWARRQADPQDGRRFFIELSEKGAAAMDRIFTRSPLRAATAARDS